MARDRYDDEDDEREPPRGRGRSRDDDDEPPRGRGRSRDDDEDDDDDYRPNRPKKLTGIDGLMNGTVSVVLFALFSFCCCWPLGVILGIIGLVTCKNPDSKRNSIIVLVAGVAGIILNVILYVSGVTNNALK
ncbi:hypothetical protein GobsT_64860 [Gemmata obscuriglobus]|uniref:DUF4190 domain-containing protein n=1 Tax=Gemmata obscuriglobus TaxID=114 RepID=A0A2Z3GWR0_9BACT|nr:hypothetical protein [Gemmata obscuriglobus]AWM35816.1 hypothetical protein C1280_01415 [Gemmata obscuriglobus]QEG31642.1 hypothetical protein GobsT_64860 [Gemmata obscuriglobus]VTS10987.1 unnamed protein product [Gemmata obscuriglobus UQM 2246]